MNVGQLKAMLENWSDELPIQLIVTSPNMGDATYSYGACAVSDNADDAAYDGIPNYLTITFPGESDMVNMQ